MDEIKQALVGAIVSIINAVGEQSVALVVLFFAGIGAWLKARATAPTLEQVTLEEVVDAENWARAQEAETGQKPSGAEKHARAKARVASRLPAHKRPWMPGAADRAIKRAMPTLHRMSSPPEPAPVESADKPN